MQTVIEEPTVRPTTCGGASRNAVAEPLITIAARVATLCAERAQALDTSGGFPIENYDAIKSSDLLHMALPIEFGGRNASMLDVAQVLHILAKGCPSTALIFNMHLAVTGQLTHMWSLDPAGPWGACLRQIAEGGMLLGGALSESSSWNGVIFPQAQASVVEGGYSIAGSRSFCTGSSHLNLVQCTATVTDEAGRRRCIYFLFDPSSPGVAMKNDWDTMGMRGSHSQGLTLDGLFVPRRDVLYEYAYGALDLSQLWLSFLAWSFIGFASVYSGIAESARDQVLRIILDRKRVPGTHGLIHKSSNQVHMAQLDVLNATMTAIREDTARRYPQGTSITVKTIIDTAVAKQVCVTSAPRAVEHAMAIVGGQSYFRKLPLERLFRDVSAGPFHPFSVDDTLEMLGKFAFGIPFLEPGGWAL